MKSKMHSSKPLTVAFKYQTHCRLKSIVVIVWLSVAQSVKHSGISLRKQRCGKWSEDGCSQSHMETKWRDAFRMRPKKVAERSVGDGEMVTLPKKRIIQEKVE